MAITINSGGMSKFGTIFLILISIILLEVLILSIDFNQEPIPNPFYIGNVL